MQSVFWIVGLEDKLTWSLTRSLHPLEPELDDENVYSLEIFQNDKGLEVTAGAALSAEFMRKPCEKSSDVQITFRCLGLQHIAHCRNQPLENKVIMKSERLKSALSGLAMAILLGVGASATPALADDRSHNQRHQGQSGLFKVDQKFNDWSKRYLQYQRQQQQQGNRYYGYNQLPYNNSYPHSNGRYGHQNRGQNRFQRQGGHIRY